MTRLPSKTSVTAKNDVEIRLNADLTQLPIIRSVAVNVAMRADFDIDSISDLELAIDEACSSLITLAKKDSTLICTFSISGDEIAFNATAVSDNDTSLDTTTFGWHVLTTLTDRALSWAEPDPGDGFRAHVTLTKQRVGSG